MNDEKEFHKCDDRKEKKKRKEKEGKSPYSYIKGEEKKQNIVTISK